MTASPGRGADTAPSAADRSEPAITRGRPRRAFSRWAVFRWAGLLALSALFTAGFEMLHLPAALLLGPMFAAIIMAIAGARLALPASAMTFSQGILGFFIASLLPISMLGEVGQRWPLVAAGAISTIVISSTLGWALARSGLLPGTTAIWGSAPGAASVMTTICHEFGADMRLVAFMQYLRVAFVVLAATLVARGFGIHGSVTQIDWFPATAPASLALTVGLATLFSFGGAWLKLPGGGFFWPMVGGIVMAHFGFRIALPPWVLAISYTGIGWTIGLRFTPEIIAHAARAFPLVLASIVTLIVLCGLSAVLFVIFAGIDPLTAYLATSPGGADSVAIISAQTRVDVPFVMSMQMGRFMLVLFTGPWIARLLSGEKPPA